MAWLLVIRSGLLFFLLQLNTSCTICLFVYNNLFDTTRRTCARYFFSVNILFYYIARKQRKREIATSASVLKRIEKNYYCFVENATQFRKENARQFSEQNVEYKLRIKTRNKNKED